MIIMMIFWFEITWLGYICIYEKSTKLERLLFIMYEINQGGMCLCSMPPRNFENPSLVI